MNSKMWVHIRAQNTFLLKKNKKQTNSTNTHLKYQELIQLFSSSKKVLRSYFIFFL